MNNFIRYSKQHFNEEDINEMIKVLNSPFITQGPKVKEFETRISNYLNVKHVISLGNGSDGLTFIMKSLNLKTK